VKMLRNKLNKSNILNCPEFQIVTKEEQIKRHIHNDKDRLQINIMLEMTGQRIIIL